VSLIENVGPFTGGALPTLPTPRTVTARQLLDAFGRLDPSDSMDRGRLTAILRQTKAGSRERRLVEEFMKAKVRERPDAPKPLPWAGLELFADQRRHERVRDPESERRELTPADIAWIETLPTKPRLMSDEDARELYKLAAGVETPSDRRYIDVFWRPVEAFHQERVRRAKLEAEVKATAKPPARLGSLPLADELVDLLAEEGAAENRAKVAAARQQMGANFDVEPATEADYRERARAAIDEAGEQRATEWKERRADLRAELKELDG
jgi:hypothetical protein